MQNLLYNSEQEISGWERIILTDIYRNFLSCSHSGNRISWWEPLYPFIAMSSFIQSKATLNIDVALTKQNYITVLNSQVLIISIHCRRKITEVNGHLFLNKNIRAGLSYPVSSQTYLKPEH